MTERPADLTATPSSGATGTQPGPGASSAAPAAATPSKAGSTVPAPTAPAAAPPARSEAEDASATDFIASGSPGGKFQLDGPVGTFGASGTVTLNGVQLHTREWSTQRVVGDLPAGSQSGVIEVAVSADLTRRGYLKI